MEKSVYVPSVNRAAKIVSCIPNMTLVVPRSQVREYKRNQPYEIIGHPNALSNIGQVRQWVIDQSQHDTVIMCDDDVKFFKRNCDNRLVKLENPTEAIQAIQDAIDIQGYGMSAIGMRLFNNTKPDYEEWYHCHTCWAINRNLLDDICIPKECAVQEDLFLSMSLASRGYPNLVIHKYAQESGTGGQPGGCATYRNAEMQNRANQFLAEKFNPYVKINPNPKSIQHSVRVYWKKMAANFVTK
jgi:hypothetical protein